MAQQIFPFSFFSATTKSFISQFIKRADKNQQPTPSVYFLLLQYGKPQFK